MAERVRLIWKGQTTGDGIAETESEGQITFVRENSVTDAFGRFAAGQEPAISVAFNDTLWDDLSGFSFFFDPLGNYATELVIHVDFADSTVQEWTVYPDGVYYFAAIPVSSAAGIDGILITIKSAALAGSKLKVNGFFFGECYEILAKQMRSCHIAQECDLSGVTAPFSTLTCTADVEGLDAILGYRQKLICETDAKHIGTFYVDTIERTSDTTFTIRALSALGVLASEKYSGFEALSSTAIVTIVEDIIGEEFPYNLGTFATYYRTGLITECDKRTALAQVAFAVGAWVDDDLNFRSVDISTAPEELTEAQTYQTPSREDEALVTDGVLVTHSYAADANGNIVVNNNHYKDTQTKRTAYTKTVPGYRTEKSVTNATLVAYGAAYWSARGLLWGRWERNKLWRGSYLWEGANDAGRPGTPVSVPLPDGTTVKGNLIKADLNFSAVSVRVDATVLAFLPVPVIPILTLDSYASLLTWTDEGYHYHIYVNGSYVDEVYEDGQWDCSGLTEGDVIQVKTYDDDGNYVGESAEVIYFRLLLNIDVDRGMLEATQDSGSDVDVTLEDDGHVIIEKD